MIRIEQLTADEKWALRQQIKHSKIILIREKAIAVMASNVGNSAIEIAEFMGKDIQAIRSWLKGWNSQKFASLFSGHKNNNNAAKLTSVQKEEIRQALLLPPSEYGIPKEFWDVPSLKKYIRAEFTVAYESRQSYYFLLKYSDLSFKYPNKFDVRRDEIMVKARIKQIGEEIVPILKDDNWELFCADEVRLEQEAEIRRAWLKKGERTIVKANRTKQHQNYIGFLSQRYDHRCFLYKLDWGNSEEILKAMKRFLANFPNKRIAIIWDNAKFHTSKQIKEELKRGGILERVHLIAMPPYAPDENPIEHVWNEAKKHSANIQYDKFEQTKSRFENFVRNKPFKYTFRGINRQ
jgi:transposase